MPRFPANSSIVASLTDSVYSASTLAQKAKALGDKVHRLHIGDTYLEPPPSARAEAQRCADHPRLHNYSPVQGEPTLLDAIVEHHGGAIERSALQVMSGATAGLAVVTKALFEPGDEVLLLSPYWPLIRGIIAAAGATPIEIPFYDRLGGDDFDVEKTLNAAVTERTAGIYVNTPSNPTGHVLSDQTAAAIARVANQHDLWVLSDEAYEEIYFTAERPTPLWKRDDLNARTVAAHTFSKGYGLAGGRVGYVHGPAEAMATVCGVQTYTTYCAPRPMQLAAARALIDGKGWVEEMRGLYTEAARKTTDVLGLPAIAGGTFIFMDVSDQLEPGRPVHDFLERCVDAGVLLTAGGVSGRDYMNWVRLCFTVVPPAELDDALGKLRGVIRS